MSNIDIKASLSGLLPFEKYDYFFEGMGGNWPTVITPISGSFRPYSDNGVIEAVAHFCRTSTACSGAKGLLDYSAELCEHERNLFTSIRVRLQPENLVETLYSDIFTVKCEDCINRPSISGFDIVSLNQELGNEYVSTMIFSNIEPNVEYSYEILSDNANWPIRVKPISGTIISNSSTAKVSNSLSFCPTTGLCPIDDEDVLPYDINNCISNTYKHGTLKVKLQPTDCSAQTIYSSPMDLYCFDCLPKLDIFMREVMTLQNANNVGVNALVSGLIPNHTYYYEFSGIEANWPSTLSKPTGFFTPSTDNQIVSTRFTFCPSTGVCENEGRDVLPFDLDSYCVFGTRYPFSKIKLSIVPQTCAIPPTESAPLAIYCSGCLPDMKAILPSKTVLTNDYILDTLVSVSGLRKNENYYYEFQGVDSNWPTLIQPQSGYFKLDSDSQSSFYSLPVKVMFCNPKSICPEGTEGLIDYEFDDYATQKLNKNVLATKVRLMIRPENCEFPDRLSDAWSIECNNCLPCFSYSNINFFDSPELFLDSTCCAGNKLVTVNVNGANPGDEYKYTFSTTTPEFITFTPTTGLIYFNNTGAGNINTIMQTNFVEGQQGVINCTLEHTDTTISSVNFLVVRCSGTCSS